MLALSVWARRAVDSIHAPSGAHVELVDRPVERLCHFIELLGSNDDRARGQVFDLAAARQTLN
jgi:hypothetical protein